MSGQHPLINKKVMADKSALDEVGVLAADAVKSLRELIIYVVFKDSTSAGTIVIEGSHDSDYIGAWSNIATIAWAAANSVKHAAISGAHKAIRVRISVAVEGGVIDVWVTGN